MSFWSCFDELPERNAGLRSYIDKKLETPMSAGEWEAIHAHNRKIDEKVKRICARLGMTPAEIRNGKADHLITLAVLDELDCPLGWRELRFNESEFRAQAEADAVEIRTLDGVFFLKYPGGTSFFECARNSYGFWSHGGAPSRASSEVAATLEKMPPELHPHRDN